MSREHTQALWALVLVQILFGVHYFAAKIVISAIEPAAWAFLRVCGGAACLWLITAWRRSPLPDRPQDYALLALYALFGVILNQVCFVEGLSRTSTGHASIIMTSIPVGALVFALLLRRERGSPRKGLAVAVSLIGVLKILGVGPALAESADATLQGDVLVLINALSFAFFLVISKRLMARTDPISGSAILMSFGVLGVSAVGLRPAIAIDYSAVPPTVWVWAAFIVVGPTALAYMLNYHALKHVESSTVALFIYLQPVVAVALGVTVLGERPGVEVWLGAALVFIGVFLARPTAKQEER
ncbi:hypothetical protein ABI59_07800 [Acidobacteria bacterium Mor1]|nr:hypothetical protein ABI59_07800 [Acidobacteria bacterium Mor1]